MGVRSLLIRPYAQFVAARVRQWSANPIQAQDRILQMLLRKARHTSFGNGHGFSQIRNYDEFQSSVPLRDYEQVARFIERIKKGEENVLWPGRPKYFAKTSGTTSGVKYIPITNDSVGNHFFSAQAAVMLYMAETGRYNIMDGKMIFLSGSPKLEDVGGIKTGRLSGIVNHEIPRYLNRNRIPTWETNCIEDWDEKLKKIVEETVNLDMRLIGGIPPWTQMYFDKLIEKTGKQIKDIFPNFEVMVYGGVNSEPYQAKMLQSMGKSVAAIETYPASEGFFAFQDSQHKEGLLLNVDSGIFFEFIPAHEISNPNPKRISLKDVTTGVNYVLVVNSNAGLWGYNTGDTVKFVSTDPYRIVVTGRIKHFISAFGEHVISEEVESAMAEVAKRFNAEVVEFTVAPRVNTQGELPYHEWFVEFATAPDPLIDLSLALDQKMREKNIYYNDLLEGKVLQPLKVRPLKKNAFIDYMRAQGKLGGQNKVPRLCNDRHIAEELQPFIIGGV